MIKEKDMVQNFMEMQQKVLQSFQCEGEFFVKPLPELEWAIRDTEDFYFLSYWTKENKRMDAVVVKKNGMPMIYQKREYTMVVAIDCVKIAFVFQNNQRVDAK